MSVMKKILLSSDKGFYKANLHCHSRYSDGKMTVRELKEHFKGAGYSVLAITDHEHLVDNSELNDRDFLTITACELAIKENEKASTLVNHDMKVCHLNLYSKDPSNIKTPCYNFVQDKFINEHCRGRIWQPEESFKRVYSGEGVSEIIGRANREGFLVTYNHPRWSLENATDYLGYKGLWAVEIYNNESVFKGLYEYDINVYDDFLRDGQRIACTATDDCHFKESALGGFVMINAERLDYAAVMSALEEHCFYSSTGPLIRELYIEGTRAYLTYEKGCCATMSTRGRRTVRISAECERVNTAVFEFLPDKDGYLRFDVIDREGRRANTNAYFIDEI